MGLPNPTKQAAADAVKALGNYITVFVGAGGGTTGANEAGGVTRKATVWTSGTTGVVNGTTQNIPCNAGTLTEGGIMSAAAAGNFVGSAPFTGGSIIVSGAGASVDVTPSINA